MDTGLPVPSQMSTRLRGGVRRLKEGFGFIAGDDGVDYFFHWTAMEKTSKPFLDVEVRDRVEFDIAIGPKGPRAVGIRVLNN